MYLLYQFDLSTQTLYLFTVRRPCKKETKNRNKNAEKNSHEQNHVKD